MKSVSLCMVWKYTNHIVCIGDPVNISSSVVLINVMSYSLIWVVQEQYIKTFKLFVQTCTPWDLSFGCSQKLSAIVMNRMLNLQGSKAQQEQHSSHVQSVSRLFIFFHDMFCPPISHLSVTPDRKTDISKASGVEECGYSLTSWSIHWSQKENAHFGSLMDVDSEIFKLHKM